MQIQGVNHLALVTKDMNETVRFYTEVLGMELVATIVAPKIVNTEYNWGNAENARHYFFDMGGGGQLLAFFEFPHVPENYARQGQMHHLSFTLDSLDSLHEMQDRLRANGVTVTDEVDHSFVKSIYFKDNNGIQLEFSAWVRALKEEDLYGDPDLVPAARELAEQKAAITVR